MERATLAATLALALGAVGGAARAQVCTPRGPAATTCRVTLSRTQRMTLEARAHIDARPGRAEAMGGPASAVLRVQVDGRPCATRRAGGGRGRLVLLGRCRLTLSPLNHVLSAEVEARGGAPAGVDLILVPSDHLAGLPLERVELTRIAPTPR